MENNANFESALSSQEELTEKIEEAIRSAAAEAVETALKDTLGDTIKDAIENAIEEAVEDAVEDAVQEAVEDAFQRSPAVSSASKLFVLSQDGKHLGEFVCAHIWNGANIHVTSVPGNTSCWGSYATEEEAIAELKRIGSALMTLRPGKVVVHKMN